MFTTAIDTYKYLRDHPGLPFGRADDILTPREWYDMLWAYYDSTELYQAVQVAMEAQGKWIEGMRPLRNPAHRAVEFHVGHLWPGQIEQALPLQAKDKLQAAIHQVWTWSNWGNKKQLAARWFPLFGDMYLKVVTNDDEPVDRVHFQLIDPRYVVDHDTDERGYVTWIRLDVPKVRRTEEGVLEPYTFTEIWDKATGTYRAWEHDEDFGYDVAKLPDPTRREDIESAFGIDFVPFVHAPFIDVGQKRGASLLKAPLLKIDEVNRQATRLHQMLFRYNKATWALETNMMDPSGRPLPPPRLKGGTADGDEDAGDTIDIGDDRLYRLPGMAKLVPLVPSIDYAAALSILNAQMDELESDLPELAYQRIRQQGELSGRAIRLMLGDAVDRVLEARGNAEVALKRANIMALTIAQNNKLAGFGVDEIGTYEDGDFEHSFTPRDVIPDSAGERGQTLAQMVASGIPIVTAMRLLTYPGDQVADVEADLAEQQAQAARDQAQATLQALRDIQGQQAINDTTAATPTTATATDAPPENVETSQGLNGSQMNFVTAIIEKLSNGLLPPDVAKELLIAAGLQPERAERIVASTVAFEPSTENQA